MGAPLRLIVNGNLNRSEWGAEGKSVIYCRYKKSFGGVFMCKDINYCEIVNEILNDSEELMIDEQRILEARYALHQERIYDHKEVWKELGI